MSPYECPYEEEVLAAVAQSRWPGRIEPELRAHASSCAICSEAAAVAGALDASRDELLASAALPDAGRVWRLAQLRARLEAAETANLPISAAQAVACAGAVALLGAIIGATWGWFQSALRGLAANLPSLDPAGLLTSVTALPAGPAALLAGLAALALLVPTVLFFVLAKD
jgi:hypothetical protein